ncbi:MAG: NADPH:quinone reductase [Planctomycetia bacterium]|nr:NADPH:quinone reductase [Planctomycetia bacterium]
MRAAFIERTGPPDVIRVGDRPDPRPGPDDVLVRVRAAAVNPIDTYVRGGAVAMPLPLPFVVGCDLAGDVVAVGEAVAGFAVGDRVWGSNQGLLGRQGTCAEFAAVNARWLYPTPADVSDRDAAAAALVGITAHLGLVTHAGLQAGETIFVSGGSGGVGTMVVQIAKRLGARVIATASGEEAAARVAALGADLVIDRRTLPPAPDALARAVLAASPGGVDVVWETLREPDLDAAVTMLADRGRIVLMAGREARPAFPVGPFYVKQARLVGFVMFKASWQEQAAAAADLARWMTSGLRAPIGTVLSLEETAAAHRLQEEGTIGRNGRLAGKIVIEP